MIMATQKLLKESTVEKGLIDQSVSVLHRIMPDFQIEDEVCPSSKLKGLTTHISNNYQSLRQIVD